MRLIRFQWNTTVEVKDDFNQDDDKQYAEALHDAWLNTQEKAGEMTYLSLPFTNDNNRMP